MANVISYKGQKYVRVDSGVKHARKVRNDLDYKRLFSTLQDEVEEAIRKSDNLYKQIDSTLNKVNPILQLDPDKMDEAERRAFDKIVRDFDKSIDRKVDSLRKQMEAADARLDRLNALRTKISGKF